MKIRVPRLRTWALKRQLESEKKHARASRRRLCDENNTAQCNALWGKLIPALYSCYFSVESKAWARVLPGCEPGEWPKGRCVPKSPTVLEDTSDANATPCIIMHHDHARRRNPDRSLKFHNRNNTTSNFLVKTHQRQINCAIGTYDRENQQCSTSELHSRTLLQIRTMYNL
jgi:hypothetical protein